MPVYRFRTLEEWNEASRSQTGPGGFEAFVRHNAFMRELSGYRHPSGVFKFRTIEEAQRFPRQMRETVKEGD